jgi:hypothetical protein
MALPKLTTDFYGNPIEPQVDTPTLALLSKRNKQKVESPNWKGYTLNMQHLTSEKLQHIITGQVTAYLKGEPDTKQFTLTLTLEEES